ncbi:MAG TPA: tetratricopeptide repeat protein [Chthonomonadaceae bacterium]|nr:tetratricopeptide repeat protein [Chthonomonadaceae bacterium]
MGYDVFLSHSSKDKAVADQVCAMLEANGIRCWIAPRDILPGQDWSEAIVRGIGECPVTLLIFSAASNDSLQVRREVQRAFEKERSVLPFRIDSVTPHEALEYYLSPVHWLNAVTPPLEAHLDELLATVRRLLPAPEPIPEPPPAPPAAEVLSVAPSEPLGNLPIPMTPFIGREAELTEWRNLLLSPKTRVLTLLGFGGMGKTRSALELAGRCEQAFPQGVWWFELEEAHTGAEMLQRIALDLGVSLKPQPSVKEQLIAHLHDRQALLALDNTEQIPDAGVALNPLVQAAPHIKWLVTSRRALEIAAEQVIEIPPLSQEEAEALFIERVQARQAAFERTEENTADIAELCRRLEGMPLAIELAASRGVAMTPRDILNRLDEWFRLLQTRAPHLPPRQRALNGAIEWSHNLLTDEDKELFAELAVFSNGFTLEAAEAICDVLDVFEGVQELRKHSFLRTQTHTTTQQMRFLMLELVREYAEQKLSHDEVRRRHAEFFLTFAEQRAVKLRTCEEAQALDALSMERDNLRSALHWAQQSGQHQLCARLAHALGPPLYSLGLWTDASACFESGLQAAERLGSEGLSLRAALNNDMARLALDRGDREAVRRHSEAALALYREQQAPEGVADSLNLLGLLAMEVGEREKAQAHFEEALTLWPETAPKGRADALHNLAFLAARRNDLDGAERLYEQSLRYRRAAGDARGEAETLGNLGAMAYTAGDPSTARQLYIESLNLRRALRDRHGIGLMLYNLGEVAEAAKDGQQAVALYAHAERILRELQSAYAAIPTQALERLAAALGAEVLATAHYQAAHTSWEKLV